MLSTCITHCHAFTRRGHIVQVYVQCTICMYSVPYVRCTIHMYVQCTICTVYHMYHMYSVPYVQCTILCMYSIYHICTVHSLVSFSQSEENFYTCVWSYDKATKESLLAVAGAKGVIRVLG